MSVYIIAEAGVNHNGDPELARQLIDIASDAGADCVKFQTFKSENLVSWYAAKADYQKQTTNENESQLDMLKKLELSYKDFKALKDYATDKGIDFCTTPFDDESIEFVYELGCGFWKIPSGEITNLPYLRKIAQYNQPVILSSGMSTLEELKSAVNLIKRYNSQTIVVLHCNTGYPTPMQDVTLLAMNQIKSETGCDVGYSDHTQGIEVAIAAAALGAVIIEKHFTLDRTMEGPDHKASLEPGELKKMIQSVRNIELALGDGKKRVSPSEKCNMDIARKSIVAKRNIQRGEPFTDNNLTTKRPGTGMSPMLWDDVIGKISEQDYEKDEQIKI